MTLAIQEPRELLPKDLIRVETALSRYPIHRLSKKGCIEIEIKGKSDKGETTFRWDVDYSKKRGQPGPLAYKVDTLIINRRVQEAGRPISKVIKLGSLNEIAGELGSNKAYIKKALHQNASAYITAKIRFRGKNGTERTSEFGDTRYGVVFTGEILPDNREADAVYIILHDWYREILDTAQTRPLDYDYLKVLSPGAQRLYELLSFQIYGAIESERKRAKLLYSDLCTYAPQTRYYSFEQVKKQMYKLHAPHRKSGYIAAVHFQEISDNDGQLDWEMYYTPGFKAKGEHTAARKRPRRRRPVQLALPAVMGEDQSPRSPATTEAHAPVPSTSAAEVLTPEQEQLIGKLAGYDVAETEARKLVLAKLDACRVKVPAIPYLPENQGRDNRGGNVRAFIERDDWQLPPAYLEAQAKAQEVARGQAKRSAIEACSLCDAAGHRLIRTEQYPRGAVKPCSHDPQIESQYPAA